jgi:hypothetical protein
MTTTIETMNTNMHHPPNPLDARRDGYVAFFVSIDGARRVNNRYPNAVANYQPHLASQAESAETIVRPYATSLVEYW